MGSHTDTHMWAPRKRATFAFLSGRDLGITLIVAARKHKFSPLGPFYFHTTVLCGPAKTPPENAFCHPTFFCAAPTFFPGALILFTPVVPLCVLKTAPFLSTFGVGAQHFGGTPTRGKQTATHKHRGFLHIFYTFLCYKQVLVYKLF